MKNKNIRLLASTLVGIIGLVVYFMSIPRVNEETMIDLRVEAGQEDIFDGLTITGEIFDFSSYSIENGSVTALAALPYLEQLDAAYAPGMFTIQQKYPDFVNNILYNQDTSEYVLLNGEDYLLSASFRYKQNFQMDDQTLYLNILDLASNEVIEETIVREDVPAGDYVSILGIYEKYPRVQILYATTRWLNDGSGNNNEYVTLGEYNVETKNYTEEKIMDAKGTIYPENGSYYLFDNYPRQLLYFFGTDEEFANEIEINYLFNFETGELQELADTYSEFVVGNDGNLYTLFTADGETIFGQLDETGAELVSETILDYDFSAGLGDYLPFSFEAIDGKVYVYENQLSSHTTTRILPTIFQVFDAETGELLSEGEIRFDPKGETNGSEGRVDSIKRTTE